MISRKTFTKGMLAILLAGMPFIFCRGQQTPDYGTISGNFQLDAQYYFLDTLIGTPEVPEDIRLNGNLYLNYRRGPFSAGVRYEAYLPPLLGFDPRWEGQGIGYRFARYSGDKIDVTVGNFYEQFGSGMIFRTYEEWALGIDNSIDGFRVILNPVQGVNIKGIYGKQRNYWSKSPGIIRGADAEVGLNDVLPFMKESKTNISIGGSIVSRYQDDDDPIYKLPENVAASAGRISFRRGKVTLFSELAYKINDPNSSNGLIYKPGSAFYFNGTYSKKGLGISVAAKRIDNMDFRSDRYALFNDMTLFYLPAITKQHTYRLPTLYPYATQPNGEIGGQVDLFYLFPRDTKLGGKYGTRVSVNYSRIHSLDTLQTGDFLGYEAEVLNPGSRMYFEDFNIEVSKKWSSKVKTIFTYIYLFYDYEQLQGKAVDDVIAHFTIADISYKLKSKHNIRVELQHNYTKQDKGSWAMVLAEYSIAPHWFLSVYDEYNYGNEDPDHRIHYYGATAAWVSGPTRVAVAYGKQREGIFCVGGVCRNVPASNGFTLSVSTSF